jgi:peptidoglycan/LPS O-acetylase OafA/YrhL
VTLRQADTASPIDGMQVQRPAQTGLRQDIEGLRAVAVLAVVLFHADVPGVGGGYIGVDVFFVISGFLITGLLWREVGSSGTVRLRRFYGARARRLLPASAAVGVVTAISAAILLPPLQARGVLGAASPARCTWATTALCCKVSTTWPLTCRRRRLSTTGR